MEYQFSKNLGRTIDLSRENIREYFKEDFKYLSKPIIALLLSFFVLFTLIFVSIGYNVSIPGSSIILFVLIFLLVILFSYIWLMYIVAWLMASKAFHTVTKYSNPKQRYADSLRETLGARMRVFLGTIIANLLVFVVVLLLYFGFFLILIIAIAAVPHSSFGSVILIFMLLFIAFGIVIIYLIFKLIPLQLYPTVLIMENDKGYGSGLKRSFEIMPGWKNKLKFFFAQAILSYIVSFVAEFILFGLVFGTLIVLFLLVLILNLSGGAAIIVFIIGFGISLAIYFIGLLEAENIVLGTFHGQSYINFVKPEFMETDVNYQKYQSSYNAVIGPNGSYCTNCGQLLSPEQNFCPVCGQPAKAK